MSNIAAQLRAVKKQPKAGGFSVAEHTAAKRSLMLAIGADISQPSVAPAVNLKTRYILWLSHSFVSRPIAIGVAGVVLAVSGLMTTVNAAQQSIPGDALYTVKLINERAQLQLASLDRKAVLHTEFAEKRLNEVTQLQSDTSGRDSNLVAQTIDAYTQEVASANQNLRELQASGNSITVATASAVQQNLVALDSAMTNTVGPATSAEESVAVSSAQSTTQVAQDDSVNVAVQAHQDVASEQSTRELNDMFIRQFAAIGTRKTFDIHRLSVIRSSLTAHADVLSALTVVTDSDLRRLERSINIAVADVAPSMNAVALGNYRSAFDALKHAESVLRGIESTIADTEIAITAALMNAPAVAPIATSDLVIPLPLTNALDEMGADRGEWSEGVLPLVE